MQVSLDLGGNSIVPARLEVVSNEHYATLRFFSPETSEMLVSDDLDQYNTISVDPNEHLRICLRGEEHNRTFTFTNDDSHTRFFTLLSESMLIQLVPGEDTKFEIAKKKESHGFFGNKLVSALNHMRGFIYGAADALEAMYPVEGEEEDEIDPTILSLPASLLRSVDDLDSIGPSISTCVFTEDQFVQLWVKQFTPDVDTIDEYQRLVNQFSNITKDQWVRSYTIREFVYRTENSIEKSSLLDDLKPIAVHVLLALFVFSFMELPFSDRFVWILELIVPLFAKSVEDNHVVDQSNQRVPLLTAESRIFWVFKGFSDRFLGTNKEKNVMPPLDGLFLSTKSFLGHISPQIVSLLETYGVVDLEFCKDDIFHLFASGRKSDDALLILTSFVLSPNVSQYLQTILCALFVFLEKYLETIPARDGDRFKRTVRSLVGSIDIRLLMNNAEKLIEKIQ